MPADEKRPEATHRQRAQLGASGAVQSWPVNVEGNSMVIVTGTSSDLVPTVQFGNVLVGPVSIMRPIPNGTMEEIIEMAIETQRAVEYVVGSERRAVQWAIDPASRVINPATGVEFTGAQVEEPPKPAGVDAPAAEGVEIG